MEDSGSPRREAHSQARHKASRSRGIKVLYGNVQSISNKIDELRCWAIDVDPDVIYLVETWTNSQHTKAFLTIEGYEIVCRHDRTDTELGIGGGLLIYSKSTISTPESYVTDVAIRGNTETLRALFWRSF